MNILSKACLSPHLFYCVIYLNRVALSVLINTVFFRVLVHKKGLQIQEITNKSYIFFCVYCGITK